MKKYNRPKTILLIITLISFIICFVSCAKKLDIKPNQALLVPSTPQDFQAILDGNSVMNASYPILGEAGSDNYYLQNSRWAALSAVDQNIYIWTKDLFPSGVTVNDWNGSFTRIRVTNAVLEGLDGITSTYRNSADYKNARGCALFFRAYSNYSLAQIFCKSYNSSTASIDLGIPLRLTSNVLEQPVRSSVQQTYDQITSDLLEAGNLLPVTTPYKTRPSKIAVDAMLARVYLSMSNYDKALQYASSSISQYATLLDYNSLTISSAFPLALFNSEVIFHAELLTANATNGGGAIFYNNTSCAVDTNLYKSYSTNDLRKLAFFATQPTGLFTWKGSYVQSITLFGGIANDEIYLIRAECNARKSNTAMAMQDLNALLINRWKSGTFQPFTATDPNDALRQILVERRKELLFRGLRWTDLRRLNIDPNFAVTLSKVVNSQTYTLLPNSLRYVYPIPQDEINISSIQQNDR